LKSRLSLFPSAEARGDYGSLATLAACVKTILLLNDPSIIEIIVSNDELIFEQVCSKLEYDPYLRDKANHRWFLRQRAKFRTVAMMEDDELVAAIHRAFRVQYLRDTLLRPTMDESSLSTLSSLQTFTHADVVKGVTMSPAGTDDKGELLKDSYLAKVLRMLGR
jgi:protein phosphatase-4 regulatory subunit 3